MTNDPYQRKKFRLIALAMWVGVVLWNWYYEKMYGHAVDGWSYILSTFVLPWPIVMVFGFAGYKRSESWWWIVPLMAVTFGVGIYLSMMLPVVLPYRLGSLLPIPWSGWAREATLITITAMPLSLVPILLFLLWPRRSKLVPMEYPQCAECGYDLRGSATSKICPECGRILLEGVDYPIVEVSVDNELTSRPIKKKQETK